MSEYDRRPAGEESPSLIEALKRALGCSSAILHTRLELFIAELEEERERLKQTLIFLLLAFFGLSLGFILLNVFLIVLFWEKGWLVALGGLAALYLGLGIVGAFMLRQKILTRPGLFPATLQELGKDVDHLRGSSRD